MVPLQTGFNDLTAAVNALSTEAVAVEADIAALQAQVAAGSPITGDQLEALATQVSGITGGFASVVGTSTATGTATGSGTSTATAS